jgi:TRAP-type C4-dicarboxylate transport system substrate-binding protein
MDRVSGWYKRRTQWVSFFVALAIAAIFNVNVLYESAQIWTRPAVIADLTTLHFEANQDAMKPDQQARFQAAADKTMSESMDKFNAQEAEVIEYFKKSGKKVYEPDQNAFRAFAQKRYVDKYGNDWPKGALERINAVK